MAATIVRYWEFDENEPLTCPGCGWTGLAADSSREEDGTVFDAGCPDCRRTLIIVPFPTLAETRAAAAAGNKRAAAELPGMVERERTAMKWWRWADSTTLRRPDDLRDLPGENLVIDWDFEVIDGREWTVLRNHETEVWREAAFWEGVDRFVQVADLLRQRYGERLVELRPTPASKRYLWGDKVAGVEARIDEVNAKLRGEN